MDGVKSGRDIMHRNSKDLCKDTVKNLILQSQEAKKQSYCPYSKFRVGAALVTFDNTVFTGKLHLKLFTCVKTCHRFDFIYSKSCECFASRI